MTISKYWGKKQDEANRVRPTEELKRMANDRSQTPEQRQSARRVLKGKEGK